MRGTRRDQVARSLDQVGTELGMAREPRGGPPHRLLVLLVDEAIDRSLEPAQQRGAHVEALAEAQARVVRALGLERDGAGEARPQHDVVVPLAWSHVLHQLEGLPPAAEGGRIDDRAHQPVARGVAGPDDLDVEHGGGVLLPQVVALEERPQAGSRRREIDRELMLAHAGICLSPGWAMAYEPDTADVAEELLHN